MCPDLCNIRSRQTTCLGVAQYTIQSPAPITAGARRAAVEGGTARALMGLML